MSLFLSVSTSISVSVSLTVCLYCCLMFLCLFVFLFVSMSFSVHSLLFEVFQFVCPSIYLSVCLSVSCFYYVFLFLLTYISCSNCFFLLLPDFFLRWIFGFYAFCSRLTFPSLVFHHWLDRSLQNFASSLFLFCLSFCVFINA